MPYVDSQIPWESHKDDCPNPLAKRLYVRDYDKNGKQRFVSWGVTCTNCGVILKQEYEHNLTVKQIAQKKFDGEWNEKLKSQAGYEGILDKEFGSGPGLSEEEMWRRRMHRIKERKIKQRKRKMLGGGPISPQEAGYRRRVKQLTKIYEEDCDRYEVLKNMIHWDQELVEEYLATRPSIQDMYNLLNCPPLYRSSNRRRGWIPDANKPGCQWKFDTSHYIISDPNDSNSWRYNPDPTLVGEFEKLVIEEVRVRKEHMKASVKDHESNSKSYYNTTG